MVTVQLYVVDAFTSVPFTGNPAAVCLLDGDTRAGVDADWMQALAAEMNLSETAFVDLSTVASTGEIGLRWFTPTVEVDICGHATLAAAHVLLEQGLATAPLAFRTASGVLRAEPRGSRRHRAGLPDRRPGRRDCPTATSPTSSPTRSAPR